MALSLVTPVTAEPLTLAEARRQCRQDQADDDTDFLALITASRQLGEAFTHRAFAPQTWDDKRDGFGCDAIELPYPPVTAVVSVSYIDSNGDTQTLTPTTDYTTDLPAGPFAQVARIVPAYGRSWPTTRSAPNAVTIRFTAGYTSSGVNQVPETVKQAMKLLIGHWYANREAVVVGTISGPVQLAFESLLWPYKAF